MTSRWHQFYAVDSMEDLLKKIEQYADIAHGEQKRKYANDRYIVHPVRVMKICREYINELPVQAAALLHDVLEDTHVTERQLHEYLAKEMSKDDADKTIKLVVELTDVYIKDDYPKLNRRERKGKETERLAQISPEAQTIKYADIMDNSREIVQHDPDFARVFLNECRHLLKKIDKGNPALYKKTISAVEEALNELAFR